MKKIPSKSKQISDIMSLVNLAEINFIICKRLYEVIDQQNRHKYYDFLLLTANNAFHESIGIIHTLLCSKKDEEVRIEPLLKELVEKEKMSVPIIDDKKIIEFSKRIEKDYPADSTNFASYTFLQAGDNRQIGSIMADIRKKKLADSGLLDFISLKKEFEKFNFHKIRHQAGAHKNKYLDDPAGAAMGIIHAQYIENLGKIVKKLGLNASIWFGYEFINQYSFTLASLEKVIQKLTI